MSSTLLSVTIAFLALLNCHAIPLLGSSSSMSVTTPISRSSNSCADPSLAKVFSRAFAPTPVVHVLGPRWQLENTDTTSGSAWFVNVVPAFQAWPTQQPFTAPLFEMQAANGVDVIYMVGTDANTPPTVTGFSLGVHVKAWVYTTPVCGSVPLMSAAYSAQSDHFYTTDVDEHDGLVGISENPGWTDSGIVAYVLPLSS